MTQLFLVAFVITLSSCSSITQGNKWLDTDRKEFESLLPHLSLTPNSITQDSSLSGYKNIVESALSVGKWKGHIEGIGDEDGLYVEAMDITQKEPYIKGTVLVYTDEHIVDYEGTIDYRCPFAGNHSPDEVIFAIKDSNQNHQYCYFFEGKVFKIFATDNKIEEVFVGTGESSSLPNPIKYVCILKKEK